MLSLIDYLDASRDSRPAVARMAEFAAAFRRVNGLCPSAARNALLPHG
ncbi:hypothetical protein ACLB90_00135 [Stenotrophomonas sp. LGBM10]